MKPRFEYILLFLIVVIGSVLRLYNVTENPPGLYIDEVSAGYNAYTILTSGIDEHGKSFPLWFEAFGEFKMPVMIYAISGAMALLGKSELAIRIPSVIAGIGTILALYLLTKELLQNFSNNKSPEKMKFLPLLSALVLAILPWHIHFSRAGFEAIIALLFVVIGLWLALKGLRLKKMLYLVLSGLFLVLTVYTYQAYRITLPFLGVLLGGLAFWYYHFPLKKLVIPLVVSAILLIPAVQFSLSSDGVARFAQASAFSEITIHSPVEKVILYTGTYISNYVSYFSPNFLFNHGDGIGRHQMPNFGLLWKFQLPFLLIGIFSLTQLKNRIFKVVVICFMLFSPISAALAVPSPHSLRALPLVIPLSVLIALGLIYVFNSFTRKSVLIAFFVIGIGLFEFTNSMHYYFRHYPTVNVLDWGAGYKDMVYKTHEYADQYDIIAVDKNLGLSEIYFKFYDESLSILSVDTSWKAPPDKNVLLLRPNYNEKSDRIVDRIYLPNLNHDIFAEYWDL